MEKPGRFPVPVLLYYALIRLLCLVRVIFGFLRIRFRFFRLFAFIPVIFLLFVLILFSLCLLFLLTRNGDTENQEQGPARYQMPHHPGIRRCLSDAALSCAGPCLLSLSFMVTALSACPHRQCYHCGTKSPSSLARPQAGPVDHACGTSPTRQGCLTACRRARDVWRVPGCLWRHRCLPGITERGMEPSPLRLINWPAYPAEAKLHKPRSSLSGMPVGR